MRYAIARYNEKQTRLTCAIYVADALRESGRGYYLTKRLSDVLFGSKEERTAEEIIDDITSRLEA